MTPGQRPPPPIPAVVLLLFVEGTPLSDVPEGDVVDPRDVMQKDLADFYLQAAAATKISRCTPCYRLHRLCGSKISNVNIFYVSCRGGGEKRQANILFFC